VDGVEAAAPSVVRSIVPRPITLPKLADVLRRLLAEGVSIRDLESILEAIARADDATDAAALTEVARRSQRRAISHRLTGGRGTLDVILLDPDIEETIRHAAPRGRETSALALVPSAGRDLVAAIGRALEEAKARGGGSHPALLTQPDLRPWVRTLTAPKWPTLPVTSYAELLAELELRPLARAHLRGIGDE
jgi:type III secretory pathway component EscV